MQHRSIGRYIGRFLYEVSDEYRASKRADASTKQTQGINPRPDLFVETINEQWHTQEKHHREDEKKFWNKYIFLTWWAVIAASLAAGLSFVAFHEARRQADAAVEANRPWLNIVALEPWSIIFERDNTYVITTAHVSNVGHSPAQNIQLHTAISVDFKISAEKVESFCKTTRNKPDKFALPVQHVIFPNASGEPQSEADISPSIVIEEVGRRLRAAFPSARNPDPVSMIAVYGCVTYTYSADKTGKWRETGFIYRIVTNKVIGIHIFAPNDPVQTQVFSKDLIFSPIDLNAVSD